MQKLSIDRIALGVVVIVAVIATYAAINRPQPMPSPSGTVFQTEPTNPITGVQAPWNPSYLKTLK